MEKWITQIKNQITNQIETLLEKDMSFENPKLYYCPLPPSELSEVFKNLPSAETEKLKVIFSRLAPFYHSGLLLKTSKKQWQLAGAFQEGIYYPLPHMIADHPILIPQIELHEVKKTATISILKKLHLNDFLTADQSATYTALVLRPHDDFIYIFFSDMPDLWLKPLVEKTRFEISQKIKPQI